MISPTNTCFLMNRRKIRCLLTWLWVVLEMRRFPLSGLYNCHCRGATVRKIKGGSMESVGDIIDLVRRVTSSLGKSVCTQRGSFRHNNHELIRRHDFPIRPWIQLSGGRLRRRLPPNRPGSGEKPAGESGPRIRGFADHRRTGPTQLPAWYEVHRGEVQEGVHHQKQQKKKLTTLQKNMGNFRMQHPYVGEC